MADIKSFQSNCASPGAGGGAPKEILFACRLTSAELRARKATAIASLKSQVIQKNELDSGFAYKFRATRTTVVEINNFIRDEELCCDFLRFEVMTNDDEKEVRLNITAATGVKDFITTELDL